MLQHRRNSTLAEKQFAVKNLFVVDAQKSQPTWLSTNQICARIGIARNGRAKAMLDWMVDCGTLQRREMERPGRWPGYEYALSEQTLNFYTRPIAIRRKGKQVAQLELIEC